MADRKQKIRELLEGFHTLRRNMGFGRLGGDKLPRITPSQWFLLMQIEHQGQSSVKDIAKAAGITSSAATQQIDSLVESGYVDRKASESDRRTVILGLSKKAHKQITKIKESALERVLKTFETLDEEEFDQYIVLNKKIVAGILNR